MYTPSVRCVLCAGMLAFFSATGTAQLSENMAPRPTVGGRHFFSDLGGMIDRVPQYLANRLPNFDPSGTVRLYVRPRASDFFRRGYIRVPVGAKIKFAEHWQGNVELQSYFANGGTSYGRGISNVVVGSQYSEVLPAFGDGLSIGFNYRTPSNYAPKDFTDGYRHFQPYIAAIHPVVSSWNLLGYTSLGASFLERTKLPANFGRNQLHSNSLALTSGVVRHWGRVHASLDTRVATTLLMSDEAHHNFTVRTGVELPLRRNPEARTQIMLNLGARSIWGPGGRQTTTNSSVRVELKFDGESKPSSTRTAQVSPMLW